MKEWYVIKTAYNKEKTAIFNLKNQKFEIYMPKYKRFIRHARKLNSVIRPLFPGYLFVNLDLDNQRWININFTYGVKSIVSMGGKPACVPKKIINELKDREDKLGITDIVENSSLEKGQDIIVSQGVLAGKKGLFDGFTEGKRIKILFDFLGRKTAVTLPAFSIIQDS